MYQGVLQVDTNGGRFRIPISYRIALPFNRVLGLIGGTALTGALYAGALRLAYALVNPNYAFNWLAQSGPTSSLLALASPNAASWGAVAFGSIGAWLASKPIARHLVSDDRHKRDKSLRPIIAAFCLLVGMPLGWLLAFVLHYAFWGLGDLLLFPIAQAQAFLPPESAPIAWAAAGGIGGLSWGVGRAGTATGQNWMRYAVFLLLGLAFLLLMLNAMISGGR